MNIKAMINIGFENINPTPKLPIELTNPALSSYTWKSRAKLVIQFKSFVKISLRKIQKGRCCFCRRQLSDSNDVDIEHFLEKSVATHLIFEVKNLALSCSTCNTNKNVSFLRMSGRLSMLRTKKSGTKVSVQQCIGLLGSFNSAAPIHLQSYRWVHPHFDKYSEHICIHKGWIFMWLSEKGHRTVKGLKLNNLGEIERRARQERLLSKTNPISLMIGLLAEMDRVSAAEIIKDVVCLLKKN